MVDCKYKLSLIVPVYNVEKYLANCLDSILDSDLPKGEYEVILVNDGSTDNSGAIAKSYTDKHANFKYVEQENQGLSGARNTGIMHCEGEYIWCVDSDDLIYHHVMPAFTLLKDNTDLQVLECRLKVFQDGNDFTLTQLDGNIVVASGSEFIVNGYMPGSVCTKFIKTSFIVDNDLWFVPRLIHQDAELSYRLYAHAQSVCQYNYYIYHYRWGGESLTRTKQPAKILNSIKSDIFISKSYEALANKFETENPTMARVIRERGKALSMSVVLSLLKKKKEYKGLGIHKQILEELKKQGVYPLSGSFYSSKKNLAKIVLNIEWLLR